MHRLAPDAAHAASALYAATRTLLPDGRPNEYAVHERQQRAATLLARLGGQIAMPGGGIVAIEPAPIPIKVRAR